MNLFSQGHLGHLFWVTVLSGSWTWQSEHHGPAVNIAVASVYSTHCPSWVGPPGALEFAQAEGKFQARPKEAHGRGHGKVLLGQSTHSSRLVHTDAGVWEGPVDEIKAFGVGTSPDLVNILTSLSDFQV